MTFHQCFTTPRKVLDRIALDLCGDGGWTQRMMLLLLQRTLHRTMMYFEVSTSLFCWNTSIENWQRKRKKTRIHVVVRHGTSCTTWYIRYAYCRSSRTSRCIPPVSVSDECRRNILCARCVYRLPDKGGQQMDAPENMPFVCVHPLSCNACALVECKWWIVVSLPVR
jgi:hypothetical protein